MAPIRTGTAHEIATQGISSPDGLGIATQGFLEPITGDFNVRGQAKVDFVPNLNRLRGAANVNVCYKPGTGGGVTFGGTAQSVLSYNVPGTGGLSIGGVANVQVRYDVVGTGGLAFGVNAGIFTDMHLGHGGAKIPKRIRQPNAEFTPSEYDPDKHLEPIDYLKKIQDVLAQAEYDKLEKISHVSKGTITVSGRGHVVAICRDLPDGKIIVAPGTPLTPIELDLPNVFNVGATAIEIAELEDHLILNDLFGLGDYKITKGPKARYIQHSRKSDSGAASVKFGSGSSHHMVTQVEKTQRREDDEFMLEVNMRTQQDREQEELQMLGILD